MHKPIHEEQRHLFLKQLCTVSIDPDSHIAKPINLKRLAIFLLLVGEPENCGNARIQKIRATRRAKEHVRTSCWTDALLHVFAMPTVYLSWYDLPPKSSTRKASQRNPTSTALRSKQFTLQAKYLAKQLHILDPHWTISILVHMVSLFKIFSYLRRYDIGSLMACRGFSGVLMFA